MCVLSDPMVIARIRAGVTHDNPSSVPETLRDTIISRRGNLVKDT